MKPMLAVEAKGFHFPVYASPKIDGIRAVIKDGLLLSRSLKPIPNAFVQDYLGNTALEGLDGELTVGAPYAQNCMQATSSGVMSRDGEPDFTFWLFDFWNNTTQAYGERFQIMNRAYRDGALSTYPRIVLLQQHLLHNEAELNAYEAHALEQGYEGIMLRDPRGKYKYGRSTAKEGYLLKVKRFVDAEAVVTGFEERMHNANEATLDELGHTKRSSHQANLVPMDMLGALLVRDVTTGIAFSIGTGFDDEERKFLWTHRPRYIGQTVTYKHFAAAGVKDKPRFPVFKAFRHQDDIS